MITIGDEVIVRRHRKRRRKNSRKLIIIASSCLLFVITAGYAAFSTNINITAKGNVLEKSRVIQSWNNTSNEDFHTDYYRENIVSATFLDTNEVPEEATESWNVSEDKEHGGVIAWVVPNEEYNTKYDLYIGANDGVMANEDSSYLFYDFTELKSIAFNNNFDTSNTTNMYGMFSVATNLIELDVSSFNTSKVTNMNTMFSECKNLEELNLNNFDTSNVTDMRGMFYRSDKLKVLDLTSFDTSNVTDMRAMFMGCLNLVDLNLCSFNTTNVTTMVDIFYGTTNLKTVYVGYGWNIENITNTTNMFYNSGVSSVTTGKC